MEVLPQTNDTTTPREQAQSCINTQASTNTACHDLTVTAAILAGIATDEVLLHVIHGRSVLHQEDESIRLKSGQVR
jgi:hypothetical protein